MRAGDGIVRAGEGSKKKLNSLLPFHPLTNIEISEYYKNEPRFNGVYSRNNLPNKIKKGAYVINLDNIKTQVLIGFLYLLKLMKLFILIVLV